MWYAICFTALARLLPLREQSRTAIVLVCTLMLANGAVNVLQFRMKRLDLSFWFLGPYWLVLGIFLVAVFAFDRVTFALFAGYSVYQIYAAFWGYRLWQLNPPARSN